MACVTVATVRHAVDYAYREAEDAWELQCKTCGYRRVFLSAVHASAGLVLHPLATFKVEVQ